MTGEPFAGAADALILPEVELDRIVRYLKQALPNEGVGLIGVERIERDGVVMAIARQFYPGANTRASPTSYEMDGQDLITALRDIDRQGWGLGAIVHSHPIGPPTPSATDIAEFIYPEAILVIASFAVEPAVVEAWKLEPNEASWCPRRIPIRHRIA